MKKIVSFFCIVCAVCCTFSCSDMLDTESTRQNIDPELSKKTDSLFYSYGIFEAMQKLADQYVYVGELRGDLVQTTQYTDSMLTQLATFNISSTNRYDSAYVYYRVINNCNYYIAHRNTNLYTGAQNVVIGEFAAVKALRAWAYLQLARNYGRVPFFTEPLTEISQIDNNTFPTLDLNGIVAALAPDLEQYSGMPVPDAGMQQRETVKSNWESTKKQFSPSRCYIPVDVVLGDMYLEVNNYEQAARHFVTYLTKVSARPSSQHIAGFINNRDDATGGLDSRQVKVTVEVNDWKAIFGRNSVADIISYIPMAPSAQYGGTTGVPLTFGADYYATPDEQTGYTRNNCRNIGGAQGFWKWNLPLVTNVQIEPSKALTELSDSTEYYYYAIGGQSNYDSIRAANVGDQRLRNVLAFYDDTDDHAIQWITKYDFANIILYRNSTVLLRLAEAFNRLGMCDAAFAILKDGISEVLIRPASQATSAPYMTEETKAKLQNEYPLLKDSFIDRFPLANACGIHCHGAGYATSDLAITGNYLQSKSPYKYDRIIGKKLQELATKQGLTVGTTKQDTINALEDIICDEYALELAFEGNRYFDLMRLAHHKNEASPSAYGANYGYQWMRNKLGAKGWTESKMYLPFN